MATIMALWLPIVLSAVLVFIASSVMHMVLKYHSAGINKLPNEAVVEDALRGAPAGIYVFPYAPSMKEMGTPVMVEKYKRGPVGAVTLMRPGVPNMAKFLIQWFLFSLVVSLFVAYVCSRFLTAGIDYLTVFRLAGVIAFLGYAGCEATKSIWAGQPWGATLRNYFDGLIYALLTAGVFAWLWPWRT